MTSEAIRDVRELSHFVWELKRFETVLSKQHFDLVTDYRALNWLMLETRRSRLVREWEPLVDGFGFTRWLPMEDHLRHQHQPPLQIATKPPKHRHRPLWTSKMPKPELMNPPEIVPTHHTTGPAWASHPPGELPRETTTGATTNRMIRHKRG